MENISNPILLCAIIVLIIIAIYLIVKTPRKDKGCNFDCKNCPFSECSDVDKENIKRLQTGDNK